jgi:TetR/AcrR family transcriptional regulator, acrAB operon repressor
MARKTKEDALATRALIIDAARRVFHAEGVHRSTLDKVARAAGLTRGAVYWHFANKAELFLAVKTTYTSEFDALQRLLSPQDDTSGLEAIHQYLVALFNTLLNHSEARETLEIILLRCEYVEEFNAVLQIITEPCTDILTSFTRLYELAKAQNTLKDGLDPEIMALDTLSFVRGTLRGILSGQQHEVYRQTIDALIDAHIQLRQNARGKH